MDDLSKEMKKVAAKYGSRVYEYLGSNGVTYWSFSKQPTMMSDPIRLVLRHRIGKHIVNFLVDMRKKSAEFLQDIVE